MNMPRMRTGSPGRGGLGGRVACLLARCGSMVGLYAGRARRERRAVSGFTVIEMIIAVGALGLLSLGIAHIFRATSDTVRVGRRVSNLNTYAAMIERQFREDFSSMTRDGFLLIRHALTPAGSDARLHSDDPSPARPRRIDELMFFATGEFASLRDPVQVARSPDPADPAPPIRAPRAAQARIHYGHGLSQNPSSPGSLSPVDLSDFNNNTATTPRFGAPGPNQYASDWILLRHVTLLAPPKATLAESLISGRVNDPEFGEQYDRDIQNDLQPAASSIFRRLARNEPVATALPRDIDLVRDESPVQRPAFEGGVIDIATTDLAEIRAIILDAQPLAVIGTYPFTLNRDGLPGFTDQPLRGGDRAAGGSVFHIDNVGQGTPATQNVSAKAMQFWMRDALPAQSDDVGGVPGTRVRCEPAPPDYLGIYGGAVFDKEYKRTDQLMLSSFNFVPSCTEFVVEWSFGKVYPANDPTPARRGQMIWHGLPRTVDLDGNGITRPTDYAEWLAWPYDGQIPGFPPLPAPAGLRPNPSRDLYQVPYRRESGGQGLFPVRRDLIHDSPVIAGGRVRLQYSYFGYVDTAFPSAFEDLNGDGHRDSTEAYFADGDPFYEPLRTSPVPPPGETADPGAPQDIPWAWPKLIRITISLVDPTDPSNEQTFQYIFSTPGIDGDADQL